MLWDLKQGHSGRCLMKKKNKVNLARLSLYVYMPNDTFFGSRINSRWAVSLKEIFHKLSKL